MSAVTASAVTEKTRWGATPIATRIALDDLPPLVVACLRTVLAGLVAIPLLARSHQVVSKGEEIAPRARWRGNPAYEIRLAHKIRGPR